jgi:RNA polymerase sigma factor (sigma-70 family)
LTWIGRQPSENAGDCPPTDEQQYNQAIVKKATLTLKPKEQAIVTMRFFENLKTEEIAEVFGTSAATVRSQLSRALVKLRKHITYAQTGGREATI